MREENNLGISRDLVRYKCKKYHLYTEFQTYNSKKVPLMWLYLWDLGVKSLDELEGLRDVQVQSLKLNRNHISDLDSIGDLTTLKKLQIGDKITEIEDLEPLDRSSRFPLRYTNLRDTISI